MKTGCGRSLFCRLALQETLREWHPKTSCFEQPVHLPVRFGTQAEQSSRGRKRRQVARELGDAIEYPSGEGLAIPLAFHGGHGNRRAPQRTKRLVVACLIG